MRHDLLTILRDSKDVTNVIVLTHNIDFLLVQSLVLPALGRARLTVFADATCAADSYARQQRALFGLGTRYRVVPIFMGHHARFHPKAVLLSAPERATLVVGSGNLTFGGWRENGETWVRFDTEDGVAAFARFRDYLESVTRRAALRDVVTEEVAEAFAPGTRTWATELEVPGGPGEPLIGRPGSAAPLIEQIKTVLGDAPVDHLYVCAPYFDTRGGALRALPNALNAARVTVLLQSGRTTLPRSVAATLGDEFSLRTVTFRHREPNASEGEGREGFLHAKFLAAVRGNDVIVFSGSANCSHAALMASGEAGNAELLAVVRSSVEVFEREYEGELTALDTPPELADDHDEPETPALPEAIHVTAAHLDDGRLQIAYKTSGATRVEAVVLDGVGTTPLAAGPDQCTLEVSDRPRVVVLRGTGDVVSAPHWIDHEADLRTTARQRILVDAIERGMRSKTWAIGRWTEILSVVHENLQYVVPEPATVRGERQEGTSAATMEFVREDVFTEGYGLPGLRRTIAVLPQGRSRIDGVRALMLRWYGIHPHSSAGDDATTGDEEPDVGDENAFAVDRPERLSRPAPPEDSRPAPSQQDKRRALHAVEQVATRLGDPEFLRARRPELLAADLRIFVLLLRFGLVDDFLAHEEFIRCTLKVWRPLFFGTETSDGGCLEDRIRHAGDPEAFRRAFGSVELAAALGCWALSTPEAAADAQHARLLLASVLGVARLPWLWHPDDAESLAREIAVVFEHTSNELVDGARLEQRWCTLLRRGCALQHLERLLVGRDQRELAGGLAHRKLEPGELLWQATRGYCVLEGPVRETNAPVLVLRRDQRIKIDENYLAPIASVLDDGVLEPDELPHSERRILRDLVDTFRVGWEAGR